MKTKIGWESPNIDALNTSGFSGLPGGYKDDGGSFADIGTSAFWWSQSDVNSKLTWYQLVYYFGKLMRHHSQNNHFGLSVRCLKD